MYNMYRRCISTCLYRHTKVKPGCKCVFRKPILFTTSTSHSKNCLFCSNAFTPTNQHVHPVSGRTNRKHDIYHAPMLSEFMAKYNEFHSSEHDANKENIDIPYIHKEALSGRGRKVYFEVRGCQMNVSDAEIAWAILQEHDYERTDSMENADVILVVTCSIRDSAEQKVWNKIESLRSVKMKRTKTRPLKIGILGCMAERLKVKILEREKCVDVIAGPDAYKDLPLLLASSQLTGQAAVNVLLSQDETYADVTPVRLNENSVNAFVSIMRGCDNMCSYCIVPFTRGRERSRPILSILDEVKKLSDQGVKEVTLLGQNVNSYRDTSSTSISSYQPSHPATSLAKGFKTIYRSKTGGLTFVDLLDHVSRVDGDMRIRFTSPHPKDFPDEVLTLISERDNICNQIHLPAQSGCSEVLERMRRGYSRESYLDLVDNMRTIIPDIHLTSDFITGFCGETEESHQLTLDLIRRVRYHFIYVFPYSMRQKTHASHKLDDNVPFDVKNQRVTDVSSLFREISLRLNSKSIGTRQCVLVEKESKRTAGHWSGRSDGGVSVVFPGLDNIKPGDYVSVEIADATSKSLRGRPLHYTNLKDFYCENNDNINVADEFKNCQQGLVQ